VRFTDFLKATVFISAAGATALAAVTVVGAESGGRHLLALGAAAWWATSALFGLWLGRRAEVNPPIARLLAAARTTMTLPDVRPGRMLLNRLWPLLVPTVSAGALAFAFPQIPAIFAACPIISALYWRRQESAVTAIEERDGAHFFVERTKLWEPIRLVRTPAFKATRYDLASEREAPTAPTATS
jgi:hypothetical protein